jgi:endonuclease/exonuclease/phosphatase family metal-dependent hydrolase
VDRAVRPPYPPILTDAGGLIRRSSCLSGVVTSFLAAFAIVLGTPEVGVSQSTLRVVSYNIKHGRGMDDEVDLVRIAEVLRALDADVITLQEVDNRTERTGGVDQVGVLAELLGYRAYFGAHRQYQGGEYGNAILTRLSVNRVRTHSIPPASGSELTVHEVELALSAGTSDLVGLESPRTISVVSIHLAGAPEERLAQADSVTSFFAGADHPVVLAGDFNGRPGGPVLERLRQDWRVLEKSGDPETYPSPAPDREIDFIMILPMPSLEVIEHRVVDERLASDHRPILAVLSVN